MRLFACLPLFLSAHLSIYLSKPFTFSLHFFAFVFTCFSMFQSTFLSIYVFNLSAYLSVYLSVHPSIYLPTYLSINQLIYQLSSYLPTYLSFFLSWIYFYLFHLSLCIYIYIDPNISIVYTTFFSCPCISLSYHFFNDSHAANTCAHSVSSGYEYPRVW